jgi:hypothetical protein
VSGPQKIGALVSVLWLIGLPTYLAVDSNRRASDFYNWCRTLGADVSPERRAEQHEACWRSARFITPSVMAQTLVAGSADTVTLWSLMVGPVVVLWVIGGIGFTTVRWMRREFRAPSTRGRNTDQDRGGHNGTRR